MDVDSKIAMDRGGKHMNTRIACSTLVVIAGVSGVPSTSALAYDILDPGASYEGRTIAEWTAEWWTWAWNSPSGGDPLGDTTGALAGQNNDGPVFFVAGSNAGGSVTRTFSVAEGRALLVPMINYWENCVGDIAVSCGPGYVANPAATLLANTETYRTATTSVFLSIDGTPISDPSSHWEVSGVFSGGTANAGEALTALYAGAGLDIVGLDISPSLVSGYYAMITGLSPGEHSVIYGGSTNAFGGFTYQVTATINVVAVPEPETLALMLAGLGIVSCSVRRRIR